MKSLTPLDDFLLVKQKEVTPTTTIKGFVAPDSAKDKEQRAVNQGTVIAIGPKVNFPRGVYSTEMLKHEREVHILVGVGDEIVWYKYSGNQIEIDGQKMIVVRRDDILAVFREQGK